MAMGEKIENKECGVGDFTGSYAESITLKINISYFVGIATG